jgi:predicted CXXCH cytochrome family protein
VTSLGSLALALSLTAPKIFTPGAVAQSTKDQIRLVAEVAGMPRLSVNGKPSDTCKKLVGQGPMAHCVVPLEHGPNKVALADDGGTTEITVTRYITFLQQLPGVDTMGWGVGTTHRPEVEEVCARCHKMDDAAGRARDERLHDTECLKCHGTLVNQKYQHGPVGQAACLMCHDPESKPKEGTEIAQKYQVKWPIQETCFHCHKDIEGQMMRKAWRHGPAAAGRCTTCHDPHGSENVFWLKKPVWNLCTNCHDEKAKDRHVVVGFVYGDSHPTRNRKHPLKNQDFYCSSCHNPHAAQVRYLWQFDATSREELCQKCHAK